MKNRLTRVLSSLAAVVLMVPTLVHASSFYLDDGSQLDTTDPYSTAQSLGTISDDKTVYGKLHGQTPIDSYIFSVPSDTEMTISLLVKEGEVSKEASPTAIFVDPTGVFPAANIGLTPPTVEGKNFTIGWLNQLDRIDWRKHTEPMLGETYSVSSEQRVSLKAGENYYIILLDPSRGTERYALHFGDSQSWSFKSVISQFKSWLQVKLDLYGGATPFVFDRIWVAGLLILLGFATMLAYWIIQHTFSLGAGKSRSFAYLLIKFQPIGRWLALLGLWLFLAGWITATAGIGSTGAAFVSILVFVVFAVVALLETIWLSPKIVQLDVAKREAEMPIELRRKLYVTFVIGTVALLTLATFLAFAFHLR